MIEIWGKMPTFSPKWFHYSCKRSIGFHNHGEGPSRAFTFKTLLKHYAKQALTPRSLNVKLGPRPRRNYHKGRAAIRHYANQTARPL